MGRNKVITLYNTIKFLKPVQIYYRLYYFIRNRFFKKAYKKKQTNKKNDLKWKDFIYSNNPYLGNKEFRFLNVSKNFENKIDWNYAAFGKLWTYNLNYFDFLNQNNIEMKNGLELILNYLENDEVLLDGKEPYVLSLRGINWIKFLSKNNIKNALVDETLYNHYQILINNIEYHLLGNHLLENGFSLLFGAYYFRDEQLYEKAEKILKLELKEQVLEDGGHYELSPMYHQTLLSRLLDCIQLIKFNDEWKDKKLLAFLEEQCSKMLSWLSIVTYNNGNIPMVNDSTFNIAPTSKELFTYAKVLGITWKKISLKDSGYRKYELDKLEIFLDVGDIQPSYQPGHAHSDTFSFELCFDNKPIIVDPGVSTYEKNQIRQTERGTYYHNTVQLGDLEQTKVWGGFRVAKRAKVFELKERRGKISAKHNGYKDYGVIHKRVFQFKENTFKINDFIIGNSQLEKKFMLHFHPDVKFKKNDDKEYQLDDLKLKFGGKLSKILEKEYNYSIGFNKTIKGKKLVVIFEDKLETSIIKV
ncbi:conserved hypothetical protein [Tenacibaculum sediminilitoris]|uniref:heparinase II/III domain-containing protein n=1 Tax=Tenacibaculum sediminilitoris TaxID=1820334 RepID=UPI0038940A35